MFNLTNMNSIKYYSQSTNKSVAFATVYVMNAYQKCPEIYNSVLKNTDPRILGIIEGLLSWFVFLAVLRSAVRLCMYPFSINLHTKISELENKLSEEDDAYAELYNENRDYEEKIAELTKKLEDAEKALADIKAQYLCCRQAAQTFIDSTAECDTQG